MHQKIFFTFSLFLFLFFSIFPTSISVNSQSISITEQKVIYQLPHPGILPDHPLYFIKSIRDGIMQFTTRNALKKAQLYLLLSDKHMSMALKLAEKGKEQRAIQTLKKGEEYFLKIPPLLQQSKKQGIMPSDDFIQRLYQSNAKHQEVITDVMKDLPQADVEVLKIVLEMNKQAHQDIEKTK